MTEFDIKKVIGARRYNAIQKQVLKETKAIEKAEAILKKVFSDVKTVKGFHGDDFPNNRCTVVFTLTRQVK